MKTETIAVYDWAKFTDRINWLNKKCCRLHMIGITWKITGDITEYDENWKRQIVIGKEVEIAYDDVIQIDGDWQLVAVLKHREGLVNVLPDMELPIVYRDMKNVCDHCGYSRDRLETFILVNEKKKYVQIGRNCLAEFLGIDPSRMLEQYDLRKEITDEEEREKMSGRKASFTLSYFLTVTCAVIRQYGYISNKKAQEAGNQSTSSRSMEYCIDPLQKRVKRDYDKVIVKDEDKKLAEKTALWLQRLEKKIEAGEKVSDYLFNLSAISRNGIVSKDSCGYASSAVSAMLNDEKWIEEKKVRDEENRKQIELETGHTPVWLGSIGDRIVASDWQLMNSYGRENNFAYGGETIYYHHFIDKDDNRIVWSTSTELQLGKSYKGKGSIKKLEEFRGIKQTVVTRCALTEIDAD